MDRTQSQIEVGDCSNFHSFISTYIYVIDLSLSGNGSYCVVFFRFSRSPYTNNAKFLVPCFDLTARFYDQALLIARDVEKFPFYEIKSV